MLSQRSRLFAYEIKYLKRKSDIEAVAMDRKAKITRGVLREKKRMIDDVNESVQQAQVSDFRGRRVGGISGMNEEGGRLLM